jgi:hypothetical protein
LHGPRRDRDDCKEGDEGVEVSVISGWETPDHEPMVKEVEKAEQPHPDKHQPGLLDEIIFKSEPFQ